MNCGTVLWLQQFTLLHLLFGGKKNYTLSQYLVWFKFIKNGINIKFFNRKLSR